ncbi:anti-sigma factor family protein [Leptolyngbya iicbica]|uniref:Fis family transcriptional regulator n=2 Tax=Cyanophyceae TaxID=3028117 RepID=A0A4Q7EHN6_9CYAN|nr:zf-HC2 domain-containing protein [Leptolyngbya sp. LK]RZM82885.1 Fis family transcriptional regulator [Leptolyngbya sp. LK]
MSERYQSSHQPQGTHPQSVICSQQTASGYNRDLDATKRDRFELLSAYLDGEVSPEERRLVVFWLDEDPEAQCLYQRLLQLRRGFQGLGTEHWHTTNPCEAAEQVVSKLNHRVRATWMAGMTAAAVLVAGIFSGALNPIERMGLSNVSASKTEDNLEIALDQPPILIPKPAAVRNMDSVLPKDGESSGLSETSL